MTLHPQHIGWPNRLHLLDDFLATCAACPTCGTRPARTARAIGRATYPAETHLQLEPQIWQDYPGSLS